MSTRTHATDECQVEDCHSAVRFEIQERRDASGDIQVFAYLNKRICARHYELSPYLRRTTEGKLWCDEEEAAYDARREDEEARSLSEWVDEDCRPDTSARELAEWRAKAGTR